MSGSSSVRASQAKRSDSSMTSAMSPMRRRTDKTREAPASRADLAHTSTTPDTIPSSCTALLLLVVGKNSQTALLLEGSLAATAHEHDARDRERALVEQKQRRVHAQHGHRRGVGRDNGGDDHEHHVHVAPGTAERRVGDDAEDRQVEHDERQLKGHAEADHEQELEVDVVGCLGQNVADGLGLADEEAERGLENHEVAEQRADVEERHGGEERGHDPLALLGLEGRKEEREDLPDDERRADDDGALERHAEANREAAERAGDVVATIGQELADRVLENVDDRGRGEVHDERRSEKRNDDDRQAAAKLSDMVEERHARGTDRHMRRR